MGRRVAVAVVAILAVVLWLPSTAPPVAAREPTTRAGHMLGKTTPKTGIAATLPSGFQDQVVFSGLSHPTNIQFASDGRVFVAEKGGLVKVFDSLTDTTPTIFADLRSKVDDYWDRGLLGLALPPNFPANPYVYVLYTYDKAPDSPLVPRWSDVCPTPPGPNDDGCVVTARLSRIAPDGSETVLIGDFCQQFPSHSIGTIRFGQDGALYSGAGDGASFGGADYGQLGGGAGSPTPKNPCGDPPAGVGGTEAPPTAEGGALRSQDLRTMPSGGGSPYNTTILADNPTAYWRLDEASGSSAADSKGSNTGTYSAGVTKNQAGATADGDAAIDLNGTSGYISVPDASPLRLADGPFSLEAWVNRPTLGQTFPGDQEQVFDKTDGGYQINIASNVIYFDQAGIGSIAHATVAMGTGWHHIVATKNGASVHIYLDGVDVTSAVTNRTLTDGSAPLILGARRGTSSAFLDGFLDEVAIYKSALSPAQVAAHYAARVVP